MKSIVITGSAGLLGSHLSQEFLERGYHVIGIDSLIGGYIENHPKSHKFVHIKKDILNRDQILTELKAINSNIECIIHCAALAHEGLSVYSPKTIVENIYVGTASMASIAAQLKIPYFINTSSMARYGEGTPPFKETDTPNPVDPYGLAKLHAEQHLNLMSDIYKFKVFHVVPHNVCGPHQCYSDPFRNVLSIFANRVKQDKPIYIYGDGEQKRSFSHIEDCVRAFGRLYYARDTIFNKQVFNIGPDHGTEISINTLAKRVKAYSNNDIDIVKLPGRPQEVKNAWVSTEKARKILSYETKHSTEEVIRDTVLWVKNQPDRDFNYHLELEIVDSRTPQTWTEKLYSK